MEIRESYKEELKKTKGKHLNAICIHSKLMNPFKHDQFSVAKRLCQIKTVLIFLSGRDLSLYSILVCQGLRLRNF